MDKERSVDYWANEGGKRIEFVALANGDVRINFNTSDGRTYESLTLASYRYASVVEAIGKFHKGNTMNNKELTELKKEFLEKFTHQNPVYSGLKSDATIGEVWNFFLPHLKSNDEIKREVGNIYGVPIKTFDPDNLLEEMKEAEDGTIFVIGENVIKHHEGSDTVEVVMCKVFKCKDETPNQKETNE